MSLLRRLLKTAGRLNGVLAASIIAGLVATFFQLGLLWTGMAALFQPVSGLWYWIIGLALVGGFARFGEQYLGHLAAFKILAHLRNLVYQQLLKLAPAKLDDQRSSDVLKLLAQDIDQIEIFYAHTLAPVMIGGVTGLSLTLIFWRVQPLLGIIALGAYVLVGVIWPLTTNRQQKRLAQALSQADLEEQRLMTAAVSGKRELQQYQAVESHLARLKKASGQYWQMDRQKATKQVQSALGMQLTMVVGLGLFIGACYWTKTPFVWAMLFPFTFSRLLALGNLPGSLTGGLLAAEHVFDLLDETPVVTNSGQRQPRTSANFDVENVTFAYPQRPTEQVLQNTNLHVKRGERIGLIGPSGAGKSTIMKLVMRWYTTNQGQVQVDHQAVSEYDLDQLRTGMAYVPQTAQIFSGTLRENLTLRATNVTDERLWELLDWVALRTTIEQLPDQLDTRVSGQQPVLSAGEVQRLELVRALVQPSSLLILDEPTSNLDVINEALILKTVKQHYHGTVVLVTHRYSSLALCDRVLKLKDGLLTPVANGTAD